MSPHEHGVCVGVLVHGGFQAARQIFFESSIFDDGDAERIKVPQHALALD